MNCPLSAIASNAISNLPNDAEIYVPFDQYYIYSTTAPWSNYSIFATPLIVSSDTDLSGDISFSGSGMGTESDPYLIFNPIQLNDVRNSVGHSGVYYKLMNDIDMSEWIADNNPTQGWQPIGNDSSKFKGVFIGNGKKITGITVNRGIAFYVGLFGYVYNATISDLTVEGTITGKNCVGGLAGASYNSTFTNCAFTGDLKGEDHVGGFVGSSLDGTYSDCLKSGNVVSAGLDAGGFAGFIASTEIKNCSSEGNVVGVERVGGFAGRSESNTFANIKSIGSVTATENYAGGFVGYTLNTTLNSIDVSGNVGGVNYVGGLVGYQKNTSAANTNIVGNVTGASYVGGGIGCLFTDVEQTSLVNNITIYGNVTASADNVGGVIGCEEEKYSQSSALEIANCSYFGDIAGANNVGGIIGNSSSVVARLIKNSYAISNISATGNKVGGLVGNAEMYTISDSYFSGEIVAQDNVGGLLGYANQTAISTSYSNASLVNGLSNVGGIAGYMLNGGITSCVAASEKINASKENVGRIYGAISGATIGTEGTVSENKGLATATVNLNGVQQLLEDTPQHGTNVGKSTLKLRSTYQGIGWDWTTNWTNQETESYPYKQTQTAPPVITGTLKSGDTLILGNSVSDGTIYVQVGDSIYTTTASGNKWSLTVSPLQPGLTIVASAKAADLNRSYYVSKTVGYLGSGTLDDPYQIFNAYDLAYVNGDGYYKIMNDIDLTEWIEKNSPTSGWLPLGRSGSVMSNIIGGNHKITGLWCDNTEDYTALIAMAENITISDLTVETAAGKSIKGENYTAVLIGKATNCNITNCRTSGSIVGKSYLGGVIGSATTGVFDNVSSNVKLNGGGYIGGIAGSVTNGSFNKCTSEANITGSGCYIAGICGYTQEVSFDLCEAELTATGTNYLAGIAGCANGVVNKCRANVNIEGNNTNSSAVCYAGGLFGKSEKDITYSESSGSVSLTSTGIECYVGGITGYNYGAKIENCYSSASPSSSQYAAGIAGYNTGEVTKCYASGNVSAGFYGAGIVGYNDGAAASISNCVASNNTLSVDSEKGIAMRVVGGVRNGAAVPEANNYALKTMAVTIVGIPQTIYDDVLHGMSKTQEILMQSATYSALGWDMGATWKIDDGSSYPYFNFMPVNAKSIQISAKNTTLEIGNTVTLAATVLPAEATEKSVVWKSSDEKVATVSSEGVVTGITKGNAFIIASTSDGTNLSDTCQVNVIDKVVNYMTISDITANKGTSVVLPVSMINEDEITGFQCDIYLPDGFLIEQIDGDYNFTLSDRAANNHVIASALQPNGSVRVIS